MDRRLPLTSDINKKAALHFDFNYAQSFFKFSSDSHPCFTTTSVPAVPSLLQSLAVSLLSTSVAGVGGTRQKLIIEQQSDAIC